MPRRLLLTFSLILSACGTLVAQTVPEPPGNVRRSISDEGDAAAELPASFFQLPNYGDPSVPPKTETRPQPPKPLPPPVDPIPTPQPAAEPPAEPEPVSSRRILNQPKLVLEPPPPATLPPLTAPPLPQPMTLPAPAPHVDSAVVPVAHSQTLPAEAPLPLAPRSDDAGKALERPAFAAGTPSIASIAGATAAVLGLFLLFAWCTRRSMPQGMSRLPTEALEVLGRMPVHGKQEFQLVRVGNKLVLLAVSPLGMESVAEVDDPVEVDRICALCKRSAPGSISESFREVLGQLGGETTRGGFAGEFARAAPASVRERAGR